MPRGIYFVFSECTDPDREEEFNRWYSHTHLPDLSKATGFVRSRRFVNLSPDGPAANYLALYEFESDDIPASIAEHREFGMRTIPDGRHIDCMRAVLSGAFEEIDPAQYEPLEVVDYPATRPSS